MIRPTLAAWIRDADELRQLEYLRPSGLRPELSHIRVRSDDLYIALVGQLFEVFQAEESISGDDWARLGNALAQFASPELEDLRNKFGIDPSEASFLSATAFFCGGYPASAYLTMREFELAEHASEATRACFDLLARPPRLTSETSQILQTAIRDGDLGSLSALRAHAEQDASQKLTEGPDAWIPSRLLAELTRRFEKSNVRAVLPNGEEEIWDGLVASLLTRRPPVWDYFPSQIEAIQNGLIESPLTFSLQMPTGAGKTTLCETLLYWHSKTYPSHGSVLLVPYRSLASELRKSLVRSLNRMGVSTRCAYGGTVPTGEEVRSLEAAQVLVCTPEALSGLLSVEQDFFRRISLVICDEGHLLDDEPRGVALEMLLARFRSRSEGAPRFVFISAIVPNVEEINSWLGGDDTTVVRSEYRPAIADYSVLRPTGSGTSLVVGLKMHPHEATPSSYQIDGFLERQDFVYENPSTGRLNTYRFDSIKTQAVAAARKALHMGSAVVFSANKHGHQGATGLGSELLSQLDAGISLPEPKRYADARVLASVLDYMKREYGPDWLGTRMLAAGAVLHHGDIPQETREVLEQLLRKEQLRFAVCTNTLAEGVNLPIRTLVLYSVRRRTFGGRPVDLLARDIKNLVGRAGRAGASTRGLVVCSNPAEWPLVERVARQERGELVTGALRKLLDRLREALALRSISLSNSYLEAAPGLFSLVDGIDATLIDLAAEEIGQDELESLALRVASETFAARELPEATKPLLHRLFTLRAERVGAMRAEGRLEWVRDTGAPVRLVDSVESILFAAADNWSEIGSPLDEELVNTILDWAWQLPGFKRSVRRTYRLSPDESMDAARESFGAQVWSWLQGSSYKEIAESAGLSLDRTLLVQTRLVAYELQVQVEQGLALLSRLLQSNDRVASPAVLVFPEHLRFGLPTSPALILADHGLRHRSAAVALGFAPEVLSAYEAADGTTMLTAARLLRSRREHWIEQLGEFVYSRTLEDLTAG